MEVEDTGPEAGSEAMAGAVQEVREVWAPYQVGVPAAFHASQQTPSLDRAAKVMLPPDPPSKPTPCPADTATLTVEGLELGPATKETDGLDAESAEGVMAP